MSFTDTLKRSLGFEETESGDKKDGEGFNLNEFINHNTTVNILLATIQNMAESPKCLCDVLISAVTATAFPAPAGCPQPLSLSS